MRSILTKLRVLFPPQEQRQALLLAPAILLMAILQVAGVGSLMPFLAVVADPSIIGRSKPLGWLYEAFGFEATAPFLVMLGSGMFLILLIANVATALITWWMVRFAEMRTHYLATSLLERHLARPYVFFLDKHSAELGVRVLSEVVQIVTGIVLPLLQLLAQSAMAFFLLLLLFAVNPGLSLVVFAGLGGLYVGIYRLVRGRLTAIGEIRAEANVRQFRALAEASGAIKEIKLLGLEPVFLARFRDPNRTMASAVSKQSVLSLIPNYAMETIAFGGILGVVLYMLNRGQNVVQVLPLLGLYGYAILRIKPALQTAYSSLVQIRFNGPVLDRVYEELKNEPALVPGSLVRKADGPRIELTDSVELDDVTFRYPGATLPLFEGLSVKVAANSSVAFVGPTGSGKTSLVDMMLGLLEPDSGSLRVDGAPITAENRRGWQANVSYVPQHIYLSDESVLRNIAFGIDRDQIDVAAVERAARMARIHDFVAHHLPEGYDTLVGERGIRLSGGQRQRIGIARALYRDAQVLVLDEATSALDGITEDSVFQSVREVAMTRTTIVIAHRLSTVRECDMIYMLDRGRIVASGTYNALLAESDQFRAMAHVAPRGAVLET